MYRAISEQLEYWKRNGAKKPLIIIGARQVGKTYSVREFAQTTYQHFLEINFQEDVRTREYFQVPHSMKDILTYLELNFSDLEWGNNTLLFFDEIQLCPELITSLKFFAEQSNCDIICSGSMLGVKINGISSFPVGYVETLTMYPMTFSEFLRAVPLKDRFVAEARTAVAQLEAVPEAIHERMNRLFQEYLICGGMPEAVLEYTLQGLAGAIRVNRRLVHDYEMDIAHYADPRTKIKALECFQSLPLQLAKENKKFQYKMVREGYNARYYDESLSWLKNAGLLYQVHRLKKIDMPLEIYKELGIFKAYLFDTGLLAAQFSDAVISDLLENALGVYKGVIYENITAQLLTQMTYKNYYYEPNTSSEIDFVIEYQNQIVPIEVKGGFHTRYTSFNNFIKNHQSTMAFRFSQKNVGISEDHITRYLPYYAMEWVLAPQELIL